jgi:starch synthase (maltosyl-transferring)
VNTIRRTHAALQFNDSLRFHLTTNDELIAYSKVAPSGGPRLLSVVTLNPREPRDGLVCLSLPNDVVADDEAYPVHDLLTDRTYVWHGAWNYVRLEPPLPAHLFHVERASRS